MKLVVISNPTSIYKEANLINELFNEELPLFHLRKPNATEKELAQLLTQIESRFYPQIALHQHHQIASEFGIKRLHYTEHMRKQTSMSELKKLAADGFVLSTSIHELYDIPHILLFDYSFYGPVFNSISKQGYKSSLTSNFKIHKEVISPQIIAVGGITDQNFHHIKQMNFDGFAFLGFIWNEPEKALLRFKNIQLTLKSIKL